MKTEYTVVIDDEGADESRTLTEEELARAINTGLRYKYSPQRNYAVKLTINRKVH
jgi:hypothetical protein